MEIFDQVPDGVLATIVASAVGGLIGGMVVGIRADLTMSGLIGVITGMSVAVVLKLVGVEPFVGIEGYSLVYAFVGGAASAWIVAKAS